jgi:hypothetical protein
MKKQHRKFLKKLKKFMKHPGSEDLRIAQTLFNLGVTIRSEDTQTGYLLDNYNESDDVILMRMKKNLKHGKKQKEQVEGV